MLAARECTIKEREAQLQKAVEAGSERLKLLETDKVCCWHGSDTGVHDMRISPLLLLDKSSFVREARLWYDRHQQRLPPSLDRLLLPKRAQTLEFHQAVLQEKDQDIARQKEILRKAKGELDRLREERGT
jgi:hypothetical protein